MSEWELAQALQVRAQVLGLRVREPPEQVQVLVQPELGLQEPEQQVRVRRVLGLQAQGLRVREPPEQVQVLVRPELGLQERLEQVLRVQVQGLVLRVPGLLAQMQRVQPLTGSVQMQQVQARRVQVKRQQVQAFQWTERVPLKQKLREQPYRVQAQ